MGIKEEVSPRLNGVIFPSLSWDQNEKLIISFDYEKIEDIIIDCDRNEIILDLMTLFFLLKFHFSTKFPRSFSSYLALIPRIKSPKIKGDCCPISLLECLYKIVAKVSMSSLRLIMDSAIANSQSSSIHRFRGFKIENNVSKLGTHDHMERNATFRVLYSKIVVGAATLMVSTPCYHHKK
ncbi:hypothetical protein CR513_07552, partial [Mucuna pruriens]